MEKVSVRFERDPALGEIQVVIRAPERDEAVEALMAKLAEPPPDTVLAFDGNGGVRAIRQEEIILVSVEGKLLSLTASDGSCWFTRQSLQSLEDTLDKSLFVRISRYELVNLNRVQRYDFTVAGTLRIELMGGTETWASRRCIPAIRRKLSGKE
ncbi:MAG: LytTR family transcriptional regulator DNA-binding domain-containing protein [Clostridiales bacterium]|nr:LytTR family transcriptional regulator DNA-binding domain-containing protein [Clostridiales bacterium]